MFCSLLYSFFAIFVICSFCGKEFQSLGRHSWRCKEKLKDSDKDQSNRSKGSRKGKMSNNNEDDCVASITVYRLNVRVGKPVTVCAVSKCTSAVVALFKA